MRTDKILELIYLAGALGLLVYYSLRQASLQPTQRWLVLGAMALLTFTYAFRRSQRHRRDQKVDKS